MFAGEKSINEPRDVEGTRIYQLLFVLIFGAADVLALLQPKIKAVINIIKYFLLIKVELGSAQF